MKSWTKDTLPILSSDELVVGEIYHIAGSERHSKSFSGTARLVRMQHMSRSSEAEAVSCLLYFKELVPGADNSLPISQIEKLNEEGSYYLGSWELPRIFKLVENRTDWIKGEGVEAVDDLVLGETYHIKRSPALINSFSGTAKYFFRGTCKLPTAYFKDLIPDDESTLQEKSILKFNQDKNYCLADVEMNRVSRIIYPIKEDTYRPMVEVPVVETPIDLVEGEKMIQEIQEAYECLD